jgi:hypothetical protein
MDLAQLDSASWESRPDVGLGVAGSRRIEGRHASAAQAELYEPQLGLPGLAL